jgi:hypothetical protein
VLEIAAPGATVCMPPLLTVVPIAVPPADTTSVPPLRTVVLTVVPPR